MKPIVAMKSASDRRKPSRSASAIVADERGRHELQIDASTLYAAAPVGAGGVPLVLTIQP